jgi:tRNA(fMet)-specific endonuclease VapC
LEVAPFGSVEAEAYGKLRAFLEKKGRVVGSMDLLIAAHAMGLGATVVTNNETEFKRVPGLRIENWM